jgi:hypothetical protein
MEGEPVTGEVALAPGATLRFGEMTVLFEPLDDAPPTEPDGTRLMDRVPPPAAAAVLAPERPSPAVTRPPVVRRPPPPAPARSRSWIVIALVLAIAAGVAAYMLLKR